MDHGAFDQEMADRFIAHHMLNPEEFWTPMPLPSIAVNDAFFRNNDDNDWSGQPEGLTYQRAIRAIENYGHYAELTMIGKKPMEAAGEEGATASAVIGPNEVFVWRDGALHLDAKSPFAADEALLNEWRKPLPRQ